jgi:type I restriction enzyme S subunit
MKLNSRRISQLGRVVTGKTPQTSRQEFFGGEYPFVTPSDLDYNHYYCHTTERTVTEQAKAALPNQFVPADAVMFTCIGATIGKCGIAPSECLTNQQINSVLANDTTDPRFLYYLLCHNIEVVRSLGGGAATPIVSKSKFEEVELLVPRIREQQRDIAEVLSAYDDLIQNNTRRMALLEQAARLLYQEWFVRLRFPGHEHTRITTGIPQGWEQKHLGDVVTLKRSATHQVS